MPFESPKARRRSPRASSKSAPFAGVARVRKVWLAFLGSMTVVGGLLLMLDGRPVPRLDGLSLSPLAVAGAATDTGQTDPVFATRRLLDAGRWRAIVIHHSGSASGSPASIEREHEARNFKGLGHHFIIGNGDGMDDGQLHLGYRWLDQLPGAHAGGQNGDWLNQHSISICLVGDGNRRAFSPAQIRRVAGLIESLRGRLEIPANQVFLHSDVAAVQDPGRFFPSGMVGTRAPGR